MKKLKSNARRLKIYHRAIRAGKTHEEALRQSYASK